MNWLSIIPTSVLAKVLLLALGSISRPAANALLMGVDNLEKVARETENPYDDLLVRALRSFLAMISTKE